jgi:hypothetical protein
MQIISDAERPAPALAAIEKSGQQPGDYSNRLDRVLICTRQQ